MFSELGSVMGVPVMNQDFLLLMDEIHYESVRPVIEWIISTNLSEERPEQLTLMICTPGGSLAAAMALIDTIKGSAIPISTVAMGEVASAGTLIVMSGVKGMRFCTQNTTIMSHQYSGGFFGIAKHHELVAAAKNYANTDKMMVNHMMKCTGLSEKMLREVLLPPHDVFLTPEEAQKYGIVDHVKDLN